VLHEFLVANRNEILELARKKTSSRDIPKTTDSELPGGLPLFLDQVIAVLRANKDERVDGHRDVTASAARHGGDLQRSGLTVGQVVQDYGSICQSVTELADERDVSITSDEFQTFNGCLDEAIAQAVTEHEHQRDRARDGGSGESQLACFVHEIRNILTSSLLTFDALARGSVGIHGTTGALLGRSLRRMRALTDRTLADVRLEAGVQKSERVSIAQLIEELEIVATVEAHEHNIRLSVEPGSNDMAVQGDQQILASVIANLVQNALKVTRPGGHITVTAYSIGERALVDVADECGGLPSGGFDELLRLSDRRAGEKSGLGLGLAISLRGVRATGGDIRVRDLPGTGCVFTVDLPRAPPLPTA
jgi:signal transduction histidine kinase